MNRALLLRMFILASMGLFLTSPFDGFTQCTNGASTTNVGTLTMQPVFQTIAVNSGTRRTFTANATITYVFTFCEGGGSYTGDPQLEICDASGATVYAYNDDFCGLGAEITWTCPTTGTYSIVIFRYNCQVNSVAMGTLAYMVLTPPNTQDCLGAIPLCNSFYSTTASYSGTGHYPGEIPTTGGCPGNCMLSGELNDVWYTFTPQSAGFVSFVINPVSSDDYDWAVYDITNYGCEGIYNNISSTQVSCNWYDGSYYGVYPTGPNGGSSINCGDADDNPYNATIPITVGHTYVVNVSNFSSTQYGYSINFGASSASIIDHSPATMESIIFPPYCGSSHLSVQFSERIWCTGVTTTDFLLTGPNGTYEIIDVWSDLCEAGLNSTYSDTYYDDVWNFALGDLLQHNGTYTLTALAGGVTDICGNYSPQNSLTFTISGVTANETHTNPTCYNLNNGTITLSGISGGTSPYTTSWVGPSGFTSTSNTLTGLSPGSYSVTVTDANGICQWLRTIVLSAPAAVTANVSVTQPTCGASNGSVLVTPTGGVSPWDIQLGASTQYNVTSYNFTGLAGGTYNVIVTDNNGCTTSQSVTLTSAANPVATFTYNGNQCFNPSHSFNFTHTGTVVPGETYSWTFAGGIPATSTAHNPTGIHFSTPGAHNVTLTITAGSCVATQTQTVYAYANPTPVVTANNASCGACNGSASIATSYNSYSWSSGGSGNSVSSLCPGSYTVTVTDANSCTGSSAFSIANSGTNPTVSVAVTPPSCPGGCNGSATANASGGTTYTYHFSGGTTPNNQTTGGLCAGSYSVTVADAANPACFTVTNFTVSNPSGMSLTMSSTGATCGQANGSASVSVTGGTLPYSYNWTPGGGVTGTINNVTAGSYTVIVTDGAGCTATGNVVVPDNGVPFSINATVVSNASCNNQCNGSATVTVTGGTGPFSYHWSSGTNPNAQTVTGLCDGTFTVTVTEGLCSLIDNVTITEPTPVTGVVSTVGAHCGLPDGSATVVASGGTVTTGYSYTWNTSPAQFTATANNIVSGAYTVTIQDNNGCTGTASGTVADLGGITVNLTTSPAVCNGGTSGSATAVVTGGTANYNYLWSNGLNVTIPVTTHTASNLPSGPISVTVTDASGCTNTASSTVSQPTPISVTLGTSTNPNCNGSCNGSATINVSGGSAPYSFTWDSGANPNSSTNTGLCAGAHSVTVTDSHSCTAQFTYSLSQPAPIILSTTTTDAHCGFPDGTATVTATGGTVISGYSYLWSGGTNPTSQTVSGLSAAGSPYTVTVTDDNGCTQSVSVVINDIAGPMASISAYNNITCSGMNDGSATVSVGGGTPGYLFSWNTTPVQHNVTASNLGPGYYEVTVTDQLGCTTTAGITIAEPATMTLNILNNIIDCNGNCNGEALAVVTGGVTPYNPIWSNMNTSMQATGLCAGTYSVSITDANGCSLTGSTTIIEGAPIVITPAVTNANCNQSDGSINLTISGGSPPFTFSWNTGAVTEDLLNIPAGGYTVTVTDHKGCQAFMPFAVSNISGPIATISAQANVTCNSSCNGTATTLVSGGSGNFQYAWSTTPPQTSATATNLCAGMYGVTVTDITSGCSAVTGVTITEPDAMDVLSTVSPATCYGACTGSIQLTPFDGTQPYTFNWTGPGSIPANEDIFNLCPGDYTVAIIDANNCILTRTFTVNNPSFITLAATSVAVPCNGSCSGTATVNPSGGTPPYTYLWSNNAQTTQTAVGLCAGTYTVTVRDFNNCTATTSVNVNTPPAMQFANISISNTDCYGSSNGDVLVTVTGGTAPYSYLWNNGSTSANPTALGVGQHCVTVTDINGCAIDSCIYITEPTSVQINMIATDEICFGACNGSLTPSITGGEPPYSYLWSTLEVTPSITNLCSGIYLLTVTDANGCEYYSSGSISSPVALGIVVQDTVRPHCGNNDGSIQIGITGGVPNYTYSWSAPGGSTNSLNNLYAGSYTISVTDSHNCSAMLTINLSDIEGPQITGFDVENVDCNGNSSGSAEVLFTSTTVNNSILWSDGQSAALAINLQQGTYTVTVTDDNGCSASESVTITQPGAFNMSIAAYTNVTCNGMCNGTATAVSVGGTQPISYYWSGGENTAYVSGLCAGDYTVTAIDANGCNIVANVSISEPPPITVTATITPTTCFGSADGVISLQAQGGSNNYVFNWPQIGQTSPLVQGLGAGSYTVIVSDQQDASCFITETFVVTQPNAVQALIETVNATCGQANGIAYVVAEFGGTGAFTYYWNPGGFTTDSIYGLQPGIYNVLVTDLNGCHTNYNVSVGVTPPPHIDNVNYEGTSCYGYSDGWAEIFVSGGTSPYSYQWSPNVGNSWSNYSLESGIYSVTIEDVDGCRLYTNIPISSPEPVVIFTSGDQTICIGDSAIISATASGGNPPYYITWEGLGSASSFFVSPVITTDYYGFATDVNGCVSEDGMVHIVVNPPLDLSVVVPSSICEGDVAVITANTTGGDGNYVYYWSTGVTTTENTIQVSPMVSTAYQVIVADGCGTPNDTADVVVNVSPQPEIHLTKDPYKGCSPLTVIFNNETTVMTYSYNWDFGDPTSGENNWSDLKQPTHTFENSGTYTVNAEVTTNFGCKASDYVVIVVDFAPNADFVAHPWSTGLFDAHIDFSDATDYAIAWEWNFGDGSTSGSQNPEHTYYSQGIFPVQLVAFSQEGCSDTIVKNVEIIEDLLFYVPTAINIRTPGNDEFYPKGSGIDLLSYEMSVFDRWGEEIFHTNDFYEHWQGRYNQNRGDYVPQGVYAWLITLKDKYGKDHTYTGYVTVFK